MQPINPDPSNKVIDKPIKKANQPNMVTTIYKRTPTMHLRNQATNHISTQQNMISSNHETSHFFFSW